MRKVRRGLLILLLLIYNINYFQGFLSQSLNDQELNEELQPLKRTIPRLTSQDSNQITSEELKNIVEESLKGFVGGFLENKGQKNEAVYYYAESSQMGVGFSISEIRFIISITDDLEKDNPQEELLTGKKPTYTSFTLELLGSNEVIPIAQDPTGSFSNFFYGSDEIRWAISSPYYDKIVYYNIYEKIDLVYMLKKGQLKYEFFVHPGGNVKDIRLHWTGPISLELLNAGINIKVHCDDMTDSLSEVSFIDTKPIFFQSFERKNPILGSFEFLGPTTYGFSLPWYDLTEILIIDPTLSYSTYVSGNNHDIGKGITIDGAGNAYVTGYTFSSNFPTKNAYDATGGGNPYDRDVFVFKLNSTGNGLIYSTYVSGNNDDYGIGIAIDGMGNAYVGGDTLSTDFPTVNPYNATGGGNQSYRDVFVFKLNSTGNGLDYSTYVVGNNDDFFKKIAIDSLGNAYVTGHTFSTNFPAINAYNATGDGNPSYRDAFVFKLNSTGNGLLYSTYVGGSNNDWVNGIAIDEVGTAYVTGTTYSTDFPTVNAYNATGDGKVGTADAFVFKLNNTGTSLFYSTYVSGSNYDTGVGIAIDGVGNAYITGETTSTDFPTMNAYNASHSGAFNDIIVFKLNGTGNGLVYSTYVGGNNDDRGLDITIDSSGNAYITGYSYSTDFPTVNAYNDTGDGSTSYSDVIVFELNSTGNGLTYATYVSGSNSDWGHSIAIDSSGSVYITGQTYSTDFPTVNAYNSTGDRNITTLDVIVMKLKFYHDPIYIDNNADFTTLGFPGDGTLSNPYRIEGYKFVNSTTTLIHIKDTTSYLTIRDNWLDGISGTNDGIFLENVINGVIEYNTILNSYCGINLYSSSNNNISHNTVFNNSLVGVSINSSSNFNTLFNNFVYNNSNHGIIVFYSSHSNILANNTITKITLYHGISVGYTSYDNTLANNTIYNIPNVGIYLESASFNIITGNIIHQNGKHGIALYPSSNNNTVYRNTIYNHTIWSTPCGIYLQAANYNTIFCNNISDNGYGIFFNTNSDENIAYLNNFEGNTNWEAYDIGAGTIFHHNGIGNYWGSAYAGSDDDNDGLGDLPFSSGIFGNQDPYPLMFKVECIEGNRTVNIEIYQDMTIVLMGDLTVASSGNLTLQNVMVTTRGSSYPQNINDVDSGNIILMENCTFYYINITLSTNLTISSPNYLTFHNVTLWMKCSFVGQFRIEVENGGELTIETSSTITAFNPTYAWYLKANPGSTLRLTNSTFCYAGYDWGTPSGIWVNTNGTQILNCTIRNNFIGLYFFQATSSLCAKNLIYDNTYDGIWFYSSSYNTIVNNTIYDNNRIGINLVLSSNSNNIKNNKIYNNFGYGIDLETSSTDNNVSWNKFIGNNVGGAQVKDYPTGNSFTYNYWDDWTSPDTNHDGIVDNVYYIDGAAGNTDPYPLIYPYTPHAIIFIDNETDFVTLGFPGLGTISNPYIIEEYFISDIATSLIHIENVTAYFIIRSNLLIGKTGGNCVNIVNTTHGLIIDNIIQNTNVGINVFESSDNTISNNIVTNNNFGVILTNSSSLNTIYNNMIFNNSVYGVIVSFSSDNNNVSSNLLYNNTYSGISLLYCIYNKIFNNTIFNQFEASPLGNSITLSLYANNNTISNNTIYNNSNDGIWANSTSFNIIIYNSIFNNTNCGIYLAYSNNINLTSNFIFNNSNDGIYSGTSSYCNISQNKVYTNSFDGIRLQNTAYTTVNNNTIIGNSEYGINLDSATHDNIIIWNDFINNNPIGGESQAYDVGSLNNFTYNYWNDWTTPDIDSNGIVDDPYLIDGGNFDPFPLTLSFSQPHQLLIPLIISPIGGTILNGIVTIRWNEATDSLDHQVTYTIYYSEDAGTTWVLIRSVTVTSISWDTRIRRNGTDYLIRVNATCSEGLMTFDVLDTTLTIQNPPIEEPIVIIRNADFESLGFQGAGTEDNPYVIEGYYFADDSMVLIDIQHTDVHFIVRNNYLNGISGEFTGANFFNVTYGVIEDNIIYNCHDAIFIDDSQNCGVFNNLIYSNSENGIFLHASNYINILANTIRFNGANGIFLLNSNDSTISDNIIYGNGDTGTGSGIGASLQASNRGNGIFLDPADNNKITNNTIHSNLEDGIYLFESDETLISNNTINDNGGNGITLEDSDENTISDNIIYGNGDTGTGKGIGASLQASNRGNGIFLDPADDNIISNNEIYENEVNGIYILETKTTQIFSNWIFGNGWNGIFLELSNLNKIFDNFIGGLAFISMNGIGASVGTIVKQEASNRGNGIFLEVSSENNISKNDISNNTNYGVILDEDSSDNMIQWNDFFGNNPNGTSQAFDDGLNNEFSYNYWDDHDNSDTNGDGVADSHYKINGDAKNFDQSPMATPDGELIPSPPSPPDPLLLLLFFLLILSFGGMALSYVYRKRLRLWIKKRTRKRTIQEYESLIEKAEELARAWERDIKD
ncbi:MAG: right-handed parallel beta-helix repeat-containing protein [Candidatus Heimdallarchaeota archaeon]|nr:MAG: right-handed parallel beta-helix repeat-containing protein [Candidatus Heimdallarchaeota archaeon]